MIPTKASQRIRFLNALALARTVTKKHDSGETCVLCICPIRAGDKFRASGQRKVHDFCFHAAVQDVKDSRKAGAQ